MWRMSERSGCGEYLKRIFICIWQKSTFMCFCFVLIYSVETSLARHLKKSGWSKIGVGGTNSEWVEQMWAQQCGE